jgi:hypothetical protein
MERLGKEWKNIKTDTRNRVRWKKVVEAICSRKKGEEEEEEEEEEEGEGEQQQ